MENPRDERGEELIAHLHEEIRQDDELIARLREDARAVRSGSPVAESPPLDLEPVTDEHGHQEP
jgi:hypothetical protein